MFESKARLQEDVRGLLDALRGLGEGRYAALFDAKDVLMQSPDEGLPPQAGMPFGGDLRRLVQSRAEALFALPAALHAPDVPAQGSQGGGEMPDLFEAWTEDEFFLAFLNGRVGLLVACPDAKRLEGESGKLLGVMADRLLRFNPAWRLDERGRGLFFGSPRLDTVVIERPSTAPSVVASGDGPAEADRPARPWHGGRWVHECTQGFEDGPELRVVLVLHFVEPPGQIGVGDDHRAKSDEGPNQQDAHPYGPIRVEDVGGHDRAVLGKGVGQTRRELEPGEVVAFCDHLRLLSAIQPEYELRGKAQPVSAYLFVQAFCRDPIETSEVRVQDHAFASEQEDRLARQGVDEGQSFPGAPGSLAATGQESTSKRSRESRCTLSQGDVRRGPRWPGLLLRECMRQRPPSAPT
jgi:hypothetical protein